MKRILKAAASLALLLLFSSPSFAYVVDRLDNLRVPSSPNIETVTFTDTTSNFSTPGTLTLSFEPYGNSWAMAITGVSGAPINITNLKKSTWLLLDVTPHSPVVSYSVDYKTDGIYSFAFFSIGTRVDMSDLQLTKSDPVTSSTPIPGTLLLLGPGIAGLAALRKKFKA